MPEEINLWTEQLHDREVSPIAKKIQRSMNLVADLKLTKSNPVEQFWQQVEEMSAGMLGFADSQLHFQPMAPHLDRENAQIWFFAKKSSDLVRATGEGRRAHFIVIGRDHDFHASATGTLEQIHDPEAIDRYWSVITSAWFESGKLDPNLIMLRLSLKDASIWASANNPVVFGWQIAKASLSRDEPDIGLSTHIRF
jgi:general stress protein 26